jgi:hypothetical protein
VISFVCLTGLEKEGGMNCIALSVPFLARVGCKNEDTVVDVGCEIHSSCAKEISTTNNYLTYWVTGSGNLHAISFHVKMDVSNKS